MGSGDVKKRTAAAAQVDGLTFSRVAVVAPRQPAGPVRLDRIIKGERLRPTEPAAVEALKVSISESGLGQPITIRPAHEDADGQWYFLVVGGHRLEAMQALGWTEIGPDLYKLRHLSDAEAALVEIDENLVRRELTPYERAVFIEARLKAWMEVNPARTAPTINRANSAQFPEVQAIKRGRPANSDKMSEFLGETPPSMGFSDETAADLGISRRTVYNALTVSRGLSKAAHAKLRASTIGRNEGLLRQIASVADPAEQLKVIEALDDGRATKFADALVIANGRTPVQVAARPVDETVEALRKLWKSAPPTHRAAMLEYLAGAPLPAGWLVKKGGADA